MTKMFLVTSGSVYEDTVLDQLVEAETGEQALKIWAEGDIVRDLGPSEGTVRVFEVPALTSSPRSFDWYSDARCVFTTEHVCGEEE